MTAAVEHERGLLRGRVDVVVVREFAEGEELVPVILSLVHEEAEELFELLVDPFGLAVRLWVVCSGRCELNTEEAVEFAGEICDELRASIGQDRARGPVVLPDLAEVEASRSLGGNGGVRGDEVCTLPDAVYDVHDHVVAVRSGQFDHEVDANDIPSLFGGFGRVEFARRSLALRFCVIAELAGFDVAADVSQHLQPPVVPRDEFEGF